MVTTIKAGVYNRRGQLVDTKAVAQVEVAEDYGVVIVLHGERALASPHKGEANFIRLDLEVATELAEEILRKVAEAEAGAEAFAVSEYNRVMEALDGLNY